MVDPSIRKRLGSHNESVIQSGIFAVKEHTQVAVDDVVDPCALDSFSERKHLAE